MARMGRPRTQLGACSVAGCGRFSYSGGMCKLHYHRTWKHGDPGTVIKPAKLPSGVASRNEVVHEYMKGAEERGFGFCLSDEEMDRLFSGPCFYCGRPPSNYKARDRNNGAFVYNGIDRMDNDYGYTADNCCSCCATCNRMKSKMSVAEFIEQAEKIVDWRHAHE